MQLLYCNINLNDNSEQGEIYLFPLVLFWKRLSTVPTKPRLFESSHNQTAYRNRSNVHSSTVQQAKERQASCLDYGKQNTSDQIVKYLLTEVQCVGKEHH